MTRSVVLGVKVWEVFTEKHGVCVQFFEGFNPAKGWREKVDAKKGKRIGLEWMTVYFFFLSISG